MWFARVEQFFYLKGTRESHKVSLTSFHLEGEVVAVVTTSLQGRKKGGDMGIFFKKSYVLALDLLIVNILTKPCRESYKLDLCAAIKKSLNSLAIKLRAGHKKH